MSDNDKINKEIFNGVSENVRMLEQLFPSVVKDGQVDFDALKQELGEFEEVGAEKYDFTWNGKAKAKAEAVADILGRTLKLKPGEGVNEDTTGNLYIEGDNLEALKLLRNSYYGKIKMIYIDPPYNTGNDFVYKDNFAMTEAERQAMAEDLDEVDDEGNRLVKNSGDSSKYHTNWLNMMYPRLKIARDLLTDDGVIFISIDDNEQANLKKLCDEVFGENNFIACCPRIAKRTSNKGTFFKPTKDYIFVYSRNLANINWKFGVLNNLDINDFKLEDEKGRYKKNGASLYQPSLDSRPNQRYYIECPDGSFIIPPGNVFPSEKKDAAFVKPESNQDKVWRWSYPTYLANKDKLIFTPASSTCPLVDSNGNPSKWNIYDKVYFDDKDGGTLLPEDVIYDFVNSQGTKELIELGIPFSFAKPSELIKYLIKICRYEKDIIILDFFSGSATTAHAVMQLNAEDGGNRKYICVQVPEKTAEDSEAYKAGYKNICEIGKERIRRAGKKILKELSEGKGKTEKVKGEDNSLFNYESTPITSDLLPITSPNLDIGFKVFNIADTNIKMFSNELANKELTLETMVGDDQETIDFNAGYTDIDVCYELLLRHRGIDLSSKIEKLDIGKRTYLIADNILVCLDQKINEKMIEDLASIDPLPRKYIFRDSSFGQDISLKKNTMLHLSALIEKNTGETKKTYRVEFI